MKLKSFLSGRPFNRKNFLFAAIVICLSMGTALLALELFLRLAMPRPRSVEVNRQAPGLFSNRADGVYVETPLGLRLRPNRAVSLHYGAPVNRDQVVSTNSLGYRNREIGPKRGRRALFLGDSITFGTFVDENETFVRQVERLARARGEPLETINAGVGSVDLDTELAILQESGLGVRPDIVVLDYYLNDFAPSPAFQMTRLPEVLAKSWLACYVLRALPALSPRLGRSVLYRVNGLERRRIEKDLCARLPVGPGDWRKDRAAFNRLICDAALDWGGAWSEVSWAKMEPVLERFRDVCRARGIRLVFVAFPVRFQVESDFVDDFPQRRLKALARRLDLDVLDLLPLLRRDYRSMRSPLFYDDCHFTPAGHKLVAPWIHDFIRR